MKFEQDFETLIVNPTIEEIKEYKIKFEEESDKLLYFAQVRSYDDDNDYHSYILFEKNGKVSIFHEFENPQHLSYFTTCEACSCEIFFELLACYDNRVDANFFNNARIHYNYINLNSEIKENNIKNNKKIK